MVSRKKYTEGNRTTPKMVCRVCQNDHPLRFCKQFLKENHQERMRIVSSYNYCAGCLSHDHTWSTCRTTGKCKRCGDIHHTLLHKPSAGTRTSLQNGNKNVKCLQQAPVVSNRKSRWGPSLSQVPAEGPSSFQVPAAGPSSSQVPAEVPSSFHVPAEGPSSSQVPAEGLISCQIPAEGPSSSNGQEIERPSKSQALVPAGSRSISLTPRKKIKRQSGSNSVSMQLYEITQNIVLRPTALIKIVAKERYILERALIDPSAEFSIISDKIVKLLNAKTVKLGKTERCLIKIRGNFGMSTTVETYAQVRRDYCIITPIKSLDDSIVNEFPGLQLADPQFHVSNKVHLTLGIDVYPKIIRNGVAGGSFGKPLAQFSIFGYIIFGSCAK